MGRRRPHNETLRREAWPRQRLRWLAGVVALVVVVVGTSGYLLYIPAPSPPRLSAAIVYDSLPSGSGARAYAVFAPRRLRPGAPVVIALHGSMGSPEQMRQATGYGFERLADEYGFLVVYPQGFAGHWNDCRRFAPFAAREHHVDDVAFLRRLVRQLRTTHGIDTTRVFAAGLSNGGHLAFRLALEAPDLVRAVAAVGANLPSDADLQCAPVPGATRVLVMNGTADPINPYNGGVVTLFGFGNRGEVRSSAATAAYFARRLGASEIATADVVDTGDGTRTVEERRWRSRQGGEVVLYSIVGGGHAVPQPFVRARRLLGPTYAALDGTRAIWEFFAWQGAEAR